MKTGEIGGKVLDKSTAEQISAFKCGFWPACKFIMKKSDKMVRGGTVTKSKDHPKIGPHLYLCGDEELCETDLDVISDDNSVDGPDSNVSNGEAGCGERHG